MSSFRRPILLVVNLLLAGLGAGLLYFASMCREAEDPIRERLDLMPTELLGTMAQDEVQGMHDIVKAVRMVCTFAGTFVIGAGVLNLWLGLQRSRR